MNKLGESSYRDIIRFIRDCDYITAKGTRRYLPRVIISHVNDIKDIKMQALVDETTVKRSNISKFFPRLGFESFKEFQNEISEFLMFYQMTIAKEAAVGLSSEQQVHLKNAYTVLGRTVSKLNKTAAMIKKSSHVVMIGDLDDLMPFFDLQVNLIGNCIPTYFCRSYDIFGIPAHILNGNVLIISVDDTGVYDKDIKELQDKTSAKLIAFGFDKTATTEVDLYIRLPSRMMDYETSDALSMVSDVLLNEFLKAKKLRV